MIKIRVDDYPQGVPYKRLSNAEYWKVLKVLENKNLDYYLGVVPELLKPGDSDFLKTLKHAHICLHGFTHDFSRWRGPSEFKGRSKDWIREKMVQALNIMKDFLPIKGFIPPFNKYTQELVDILNEFDFEFLTGGPETLTDEYFLDMNFGKLRLYLSTGCLYTVKGNIYDILRMYNNIPEDQHLTLHLPETTI